MTGSAKSLECKYQLMSNKDKKLKLYIIIIAVVLVMMPVAAYIFFHSEVYYRNYLDRCIRNNEEKLDQLTSVMEKQYSEGLDSIDYRIEEAPDEIKLILEALREKNQKYSTLREYMGIKAFYDDQGDMMYEVMVKERKTGGDGQDSPDLWGLYLIYIDEGYDGKQPEAAADVVNGKWHYWSRSLYSG